MRFHEFANPRDYAPTETDAKDFRQPPLPILPQQSVDELASSVPRSGRRPPSKPTERSDAL
jgi:hypothetical protein